MEIHKLGLHKHSKTPIRNIHNLSIIGACFKSGQPIKGI
jgi:hypothetical protein